jgi:cytochrome c biogenesis protein CcdA
MKLGLSTVALGIIAIIAGILTLVWPDMLRWIVGIFLIVWGLLTFVGKR